MTKQDKYELAKWAIKHAQNNGAQQVSVAISNSRSSGVDIRAEKIDKLEQSIESSLSIRLFVDKKYSMHSTNRLKKEELLRFINEAIEGTRYLSEDDFRSLPDPDMYYKGGGVNLNTLDANFDKLQPQDKIDLAFEVEKEVLGKDERLITVSTGYYDGMNERVLVTSNGFEGDTAYSYYGLNASVSVHGGDARPEAGWGESALFFDQLMKEGIGRKALDRALRKIGQRKVESGRMKMIVENRIVSRIFSPLISALNGAAIQQRNSFLINKLDEQVFSELLNVTDDPFIPSGRGSRLFDGEGLACKKTQVFHHGALKRYYVDTYYGKKLDMQPTGGSTTNLVFEPGDRDLEELVNTVDKGILVTGFNGGNCNGSSGDFSYGIEGFLIEDGNLVKPVSEMNITGNMIGLWSSIEAVGKDVYRNSAWLTPSILFREVDFSGL